MDESLKLFIMEFVFRKISQASHEMFKSEEDNANCLIVLDEAGRFIPQSTGDNKDLARIGGYIENKVKELRKYGVGFQFITQTLTEIKKEIFRSLHYRVYGVGMSVGADAGHIENREGKKNFETYSSLPDPKLSGVYSFMISGTLVAMGTTGKPMFIEGFESDDEVLRENRYPTTNDWSNVSKDSFPPSNNDENFDTFFDDPDPWDNGPDDLGDAPF
jgi:DNA helicase HerA-like ATPase